MPTDSHLTAAVEVAARLAAATVPAFSQAHDLILANNDDSLLATREWFTAIEYCLHMRDLTDRSINLSVAVLLGAISERDSEQPTEVPEQCPQQQQTGDSNALQQLLQMDVAFNVLVMVLIDQAAGLHHLAADETSSNATAASTPLISQVASNLNHLGPQAAATMSGSQQQQQQQRPPAQRQRVLQSHINCLSHLGLCSTWQDDSSCIFSEIRCSAGVEFLKDLIEDMLCSDEIAFNEAASAVQHSIYGATAPSRLAYSTIRLLIEIILLLPPQHVGLLANSLELLLLLLQYIQASATPGKEDEEYRALHLPSTDRFIGLKILIPPSTAAALLHPVVQLLSRAVIQALKETEPQQQQLLQEQQQQQDSTSGATESDRLLVLQHYGSLLLAVCQTGEGLLHITDLPRCIMCSAGPDSAFLLCLSSAQALPDAIMAHTATHAIMSVLC